LVVVLETRKSPGLVTEALVVVNATKATCLMQMAERVVLG
jgi:hypothetical protein